MFVVVCDFHSQSYLLESQSNAFPGWSGADHAALLALGYMAVHWTKTYPLFRDEADFARAYAIDAPDPIGLRNIALPSPFLRRMQDDDDDDA